MSDGGLFVARLHPLVVHLPIGALLVWVMVEVLTWKDGRGSASRLRRWIAAVTWAAALAGVMTGWMLADRESSGEAVERHRYLALALAAAVTVASVAEFATAGRRAWVWTKRGALAGAMVLVILAGHAGASLTHGPRYLADPAPEWLKAWLAADAPERPALRQPAEGVALDDAERVDAFLAKACHRCHGAKRKKGGLRLDTREGILASIKPGSAPDSELFRRVALPKGHEEAMPPKGKRVPEEDVLALMRWINDGAPEPTRSEPAGASPKEEAPASDLPKVRKETGARIVEGPGTSAGELFADYSLGADAVTPESVRPLARIAGRLAELSFAGRVLAPGVVDALPSMPGVRRLHLERTDVDTSRLRKVLLKAPNVAYLNVHSTRVDSDVLADLERLPELGRLVLFGCPIEPGALEAFAARKPGVVTTGSLELRPPFEKSAPRRVLAADASKGRIALLQETTIGRFDLLWEHAITHLHDLQVLPGGRVLFQDSWTRLLEVDIQSGKTLWSYDASSSNRARPAERVEVHAFRRLAGGVTMVAESGPARVIEVDAQGALVHAVPLKVDKPDVHHDTRLVRKTRAGTYLVAHEADGVVREYDRAGRIVWSYAVPLFGKKRAPGHGLGAWGNQVFAAERLESGNTLITTGNGHGVLEVDEGGKIVWRLRGDELVGVRLAWVTTVQVLRNGNLVIGNCHAGPEQPQLVEITRDKKVVWTFRDFERFGNALSNAWVIEDGEAR